MKRETLTDNLRHAFDGYLADFRGVHYYVLHAIGKDSTLKNWYLSERQQRGFCSDPVLSLLRRHRDIAVHEKPSEFRIDATVHLGTNPPRSERRWRFDDLPNEEVVSACDAALGKLEALVVACETKGIT
jgi:hypothetical protein